MNRICSFCGTVLDETVRNCPNCGAPDDGTLSAPAADEKKRLPFEDKIRGFGDRLAQSWGMNKVRASSAGFLELAIRATFLDGAAYRQVAANAHANAGALLILVLAALAGWGGDNLFDTDIDGTAILEQGAYILVRLIVYMLAVGIMALLSYAVLHKKLSFGKLFRALSYAQTPGVLVVIPVLGWGLGLWRVCTSIVAVREISGADTKRSAILLAAGIAGIIVLNALLDGALQDLIFDNFM